MKRIYLIDCPGVVPPSNGDSEEDILLRGVVRVENVENPAQYIPAVLRRAQTRHLERTYEMKHADYNDDAMEFLSILARKGGRLLRGGEPDVDGVAKMVLNDFLRGKIPWFSAPPRKDGAVGKEERTEVVDGREGRLGEMPSKGQKRKRDDTESGTLAPDTRNDAEGAALPVSSDADDDTEDSFNGLEGGLEISETDEIDANDNHEHGGQVEEEEEADHVPTRESPLQTFSSDEEDSGGVSAG
jgi:nuclear GTP-binding protein